LNFRKKRFICAFWLSVHMKSVVEQGFFHKFTFNNKALQTFVEFQYSKFERCRIGILILSHHYIYP